MFVIIVRMLKTLHNKYISVLLHAVIIVIFSLTVTISTYAVVTRRNAPMDPRVVDVGVYSITGEYLVTLPCATADGYDSAKPILPEARGLPFNYNFYDPCDGYKILRDGFLLDFGFWIIICGCLYMFLRSKRVKPRRMSAE